MADEPLFDRARRGFLRMSGIAALSMLAVRSGPAPAQPSTGAAAMKIGIVGSGKLGGAVGSRWVKAGHEVLFSSRHPEELKGLVEGLGALARAGNVREAIASAR